MSGANCLNCNIDTSGLTRSEKKLIEEIYKNNSAQYNEHRPKYHGKKNDANDKKHDCDKKPNCNSDKQYDYDLA